MEGKKGLPHLFNNGKPSEMSDKDFYEFIKWLDEEDGSINTKNAKINEKLDGSSQFFGLDNKGFFWEKFGSDTRFYSEEEIPDYWAGYRELFSDMKEALDNYLFDFISGDGLSTYNEVKVQIEVITAAGSHNENNYQINLVPYRKDAFKSKGCLSIIQILLDGKNCSAEDYYKDEIKDILSKYDYTVYAGYSIENFDIDLSKEAMSVLTELENYPFELESDKFGINVFEPEDLFDLPTRKYNQSKLKQIFAKAKEEMAAKILSDMVGLTGALTENGMFEGLAIVLSNGMAFKVNSPDFKSAFLKHHQDAVARKMNKVTEAKKEEKADEDEETEPKKNKVSLTASGLQKDADLLDYFMKNFKDKDAGDDIFIKKTGAVCMYTKSSLASEFKNLSGDFGFDFNGVTYTIHKSAAKGDNYGFDIVDYKNKQSKGGAITTNTQEFLYGAIIQQILNHNKSISFTPIKCIKDYTNDWVIAFDDIKEIENILNCKIDSSKIEVLDPKNWSNKNFEVLLNSSFNDIKSKLGTVNRVIRCDSTPNDMPKGFVDKLFKAASGEKDTYAPADVYMIDSSKVNEINSALKSAISSSDDFVDFSNTYFNKGWLVPVSLKKGNGHWEFFHGQLPPEYIIDFKNDVTSVDFSITGNSYLRMTQNSIESATGLKGHNAEAKFEFRSKGTGSVWQCQAGFEGEKAYVGNLKDNFNVVFGKQKDIKPENLEQLKKAVYNDAEKCWDLMLGAGLSGKIRIMDDGSPIHPRTKDEFLNLLFSKESSWSSMQGRIGIIRTMIAFCNAVLDGRDIDVVSVIQKTFKVEQCQDTLKIS